MREELEKIKSFKNVIVHSNKEKYCVYIRIVGNEAITKDILNNIDELDYEYLDFGIFFIWFNVKDSEKVIKKFKEEF